MQRPLRTFGFTLATVACCVSLSLAQRTDKAYFGTWTLNVAKSKYEPGPGPKSSTRTHEDRGDGVIVVTTQGVNAQGNPTFIQYAYKLDGKDYPVAARNSATIGTIALKGVDAFTVTFTQKQDGKVTSTGTRTMSKDRRTMTIITKGTTARGQPFSNTTVWEKQ